MFRVNLIFVLHFCTFGLSDYRVGTAFTSTDGGYNWCAGKLYFRKYNCITTDGKHRRC